MKDNIYEAIIRLPEHLITDDIYQAGIEEGDIRLINVLPKSHQTPEVINRLINSKSWSFHSFDIENIPAHCITQEVCDCAVDRSKDNYSKIPDNYKSIKMTLLLMVSLRSNLQLLQSIPKTAWNTEALYKGINSLYGSTNSTGNRHGYTNYGANKESEMREIQILLHYFPVALKDKGFYHGLFTETKMSGADIEFLTPDKYKDKAYWDLMAAKDFNRVPVEKYTYNILLSGISNKSSLSVDDIFDERKLRGNFYHLINDQIADIAVKDSPYNFKKLPLHLQTTERLLFTIQNNHNYSHYDSMLNNEECIHLLTSDVCKELVKSQVYSLPKFPEKIWNIDFIQFCMTNAPHFYWFKQLPTKLQTQEIVNAAIDYYEGNIQYVHPVFINSGLAMKIFRSNENFKEHLPQKYFQDFESMTGLDTKFYGGETTFIEMKEKRENFTWCKVGNTYIGFYNTGNYRNATSHVVMTRAEYPGEKPQVIFERRINTFHKTWLEKQIADYDHKFSKPTIGRGLKNYQLNQYYDVEVEESTNGITLYKNTFRGETVVYIACQDGNIHVAYNRKDALAYFKPQVCAIAS